MSPRAPSDDELVAMAAAGNQDAQGALREAALALPASGFCSRFEAASLAEIPARMAAAHGAVVDRLKLAGVLLVRAETLEAVSSERARAFKDEAAGVLACLAADGCREAAVALAALLDGMADEGDEFAGEALGILSDTLPADVMREATGFGRLMRGEMAGTA